MSAKNTCCFTGHRPNKLPFGYDEGHMDCIRLKAKLAEAIGQMYKRGVTAFITGMAQGVDIWAAEIVVDLKRAYPGEPIRLTAIIPFKGQADRWSEAYRRRYLNILKNADEAVVLHPHYVDGCMYERNRAMVDASGYMIAVFDGTGGGTKYTVEYARRRGLEVVVVPPRGLPTVSAMLQGM